VLKYIRWLFWKRRAKRAIGKGLTTRCILCDDFIFPGQFVAVCAGEIEENDRLVHAGFHFTLRAQNFFCETATVGIGWWNGKRVVGWKETIAKTHSVPIR